MSAAETTRRPVFAWVILIWVLLGVVALIAGYATVLGFVDAVPEEELAPIRAIGWPHWLMSAVGGCLNVAGAVQLLRRKAVAAPIFAMAFFIVLIDTVYLYASGQLETIFPHVGPLIVGIAIAAMIVGYAYNLRMRGRLT